MKTWPGICSKLWHACLESKEQVGGLPGGSEKLAYAMTWATTTLQSADISTYKRNSIVVSVDRRPNVSCFNDVQHVLKKFGHRKLETQTGKQTSPKKNQMREVLMEDKLEYLRSMMSRDTKEGTMYIARPHSWDDLRCSSVLHAACLWKTSLHSFQHFLLFGDLRHVSSFLLYQVFDRKWTSRDFRSVETRDGCLLQSTANYPAIFPHDVRLRSIFQVPVPLQNDSHRRKEIILISKNTYQSNHNRHRDRHIQLVWFCRLGGFRKSRLCMCSK